MKILLIKPRWFHDGDGYRYREITRTPPLNLGIIAAFSRDHDVRIIDEDVDDIEFSSDWDLVGITASTFTSRHAYEISEGFRNRGVKTVLGGVHPSLMPKEALKNCDSVVIGEAEPVWQDLLHDLEKNQLRKAYNGNYLEDLDTLPFPRRDLFSAKYFTEPIQITRGCVNLCNYCYLRSVPWGKWRRREDLDKVYDEFRQVKNRNFFIVDDNLFADHDYVKRLLRKIAPLKKKWHIQAPTTIGYDEELLELMAAAGCYAVTVGIQTANQQSLDAASMLHTRVDRHKEVVRRLKKAGIIVQAFLMFGFDTDGKDSFSATVEMVKRLGISDVVCYILTPYPGTQLFKELDAEGRILTYDWAKYSWWNCVFEPRQMSPEELKAGLCMVYRQLEHHFRRTALRRLWQYRRGVLKNFSVLKMLARDYLRNRVDAETLP